MLSVVLATYNEEKNIRRCLQAIKKMADEIIVVDGRSADKTAAIAKRLGAKVISTSNKANFHINKQMAIDAAKGDLILQLDADEVVDPELAKFIDKIHCRLLALRKQSKSGQKIRQVDGCSAWWIKRKNLFLQHWLKKGGQYPDPVIRLFIKGRARLPQKDVHEQMEVDGRVGWAEGHLLHYANPTFADYWRKFNTYTSFKARQLYERKVAINFFNNWRFLLAKPLATWFSLFIRHKGFVDGLPGFIFAVFSGLHHAIAYLKLWELYEEEKA